MKYFSTILILLLLVQFSFGQDSTQVGLERTQVKRLINQKFANLVNPQSNTIIGNFASIDLKEAEVNFAGNILFKNGSILGLKAKGGVLDGLLPIFSNSELNSKFGLDLQYNFLDFRKKSIQYFNEDFTRLQKKKLKITQDHALKAIEIEHGNLENELNIEINRIESEIKKKENSMEVLIKLINSNEGLNRDSLNFQRKKIQMELSKQETELNYKKNQLLNLPSKEAQLFELDNWRAKELRNAESELKIYGFKLAWFSIGYGISNNSFRLFDPSLPLESQVTRSNFVGHVFKLNYNIFRLTPAPYESYFISIGAGISLDDNLPSLRRIELSDSRNYGINPNDRVSTSKYNVFQGLYQSNLLTASINGDFYYFLFEDNKAAIHFFPEQRIAKGIEPITNLGFGFLLTFKDQSNLKNIINAEVYANLFDIADNRNSEINLLSRSSYGLRFTFPINFNLDTK
ncbi:hypothetical protein CLV48_1108 [Cecembia rubra]|uniref:Outer membrane protein with beta-barrel domain n=1 Tax=Cecembia rubra TaxID=1485585 RepID=A0A2P8DYC1_9BACT|nr:hypothetical protein CLV48_1108 [Cecembia rubra]